MMMMIINYYAPTYTHQKGLNLMMGVENKVYSQISCLSKLGVSVNRIGVYPYPTSYRMLMATKIKLKREFVNCIRNSDKNTIAYIRGIRGNIFTLPLLLLFGRGKIVYESQSIVKNEIANRCVDNDPLLMKLLRLCHRKTYPILEKYEALSARGIVSVTNEITEYNRSITHNNLQYLTLGNGINVSSFPLRKIPQYDDILNILCVAKVALWHGIDRFINGLFFYAGDKTIILHIVGDGDELPNLKSLTSKLHLESHVVFHGFKSGADLDAVFDQCHIALGSLAGFRINMHEMSSLKSGEYCARGIPFILAATAMDFPEDWPYIFHVPETETPINMDDVIGFADRVLANPNHVQEMREYAESHLDWMIKMKVLKEFLENL